MRSSFFSLLLNYSAKRRAPPGAIGRLIDLQKGQDGYLYERTVAPQRAIL
jgi:hypothetical protein